MSITNDQQLNRYSISLHDFEKASEFVSEARKHSRNGIVYEALLSMAIISYCRPFSPNEKRGAIQSNTVSGTRSLSRATGATSRLVIGDLEIALSNSENEIHNQCKTLRNKALAHSAFGKNPTSHNPKTGITMSRFFSLPMQFDLDGLAGLIERLKNACHVERVRLQSTLHK